MDYGQHKTLTDAGDDVGKDFARDALPNFAVMALLMALMDV